MTGSVQRAGSGSDGTPFPTRLLEPSAVWTGGRGLHSAGAGSALALETRKVLRRFSELNSRQGHGSPAASSASTRSCSALSPGLLPSSSSPHPRPGDPAPRHGHQVCVQTVTGEPRRASRPAFPECRGPPGWGELGAAPAPSAAGPVPGLRVRGSLLSSGCPCLSLPQFPHGLGGFSGSLLPSKSLSIFSS